MCKENKLEVELELEAKNDAYWKIWNNFVVTCVSLKNHTERVGGRIKMIQHNKGISTVIS